MLALRFFPIRLILLCGSVASLSGQAVLQPGDRVRLQTSVPRRTVAGKVLVVGPDTLVLAPAGIESGLGTRLFVPLDEVRVVEVWRGRRSAWQEGATVGSFAGFVTASLIFAARMRNCIGFQCDKVVLWIPYGGAGSLGGAMLGALVGTAFKLNNWSRLPVDRVRPRLVARDGRVGIGLSLQL